MPEYIVTNRAGDFLMHGDIVTGGSELGVFEGVAGYDPEGGGMLILVNGKAQYAAYWGVDVEEIEDEPDYVFYEYEEDDYSGYYPEDDYFGDLDREYDDIY